MLNQPRIQMTHYLSDRLPIREIRIEPRFQAGVSQDQRHPVVHLGGSAPCRLGENGTAQTAILTFGIDTGEGERLAIASSDVLALLNSLRAQPLVATISRNEAAMFL